MKEVKRETHNGSRHYNVDGTLYPSVSTILSIISKPALISWAAKQGSLANMKAAQDQALNIGSEAHSLIEANLKDATEVEMDVLVASLSHPKEALQSFSNFIEWKSKNEFQIIHSEFTCFSKKHGFAGTADGIALVNGYLTLIDWKTSSGVWDEYWLQCEAYATAVDEMVENKILQLPGKIKKRLVLRLPKKEIGFQPACEDRRVDDFLTFMSALDLWHGMNSMKERYKHHREQPTKSTSHSKTS